MNKKNTIRLTESDLKRVISESVKKVLKENEKDMWTTSKPRKRKTDEQVDDVVFELGEVMRKLGWLLERDYNDKEVESRDLIRNVMSTLEQCYIQIESLNNTILDVE